MELNGDEGVARGSIPELQSVGPIFVAESVQLKPGVGDGVLEGESDERGEAPATAVRDKSEPNWTLVSVFSSNASFLIGKMTVDSLPKTCRGEKIFQTFTL